MTLLLVRNLAFSQSTLQIKQYSKKVFAEKILKKNYESFHNMMFIFY